MNTWEKFYPRLSMAFQNGHFVLVSGKSGVGLPTIVMHHASRFGVAIEQADIKKIRGVPADFS
jgi:hypothetical protein